jgi:hypothetical protein
MPALAAGLSGAGSGNHHPLPASVAPLRLACSARVDDLPHATTVSCGMEFANGVRHNVIGGLHCMSGDSLVVCYGKPDKLSA